MLNFQNLITKDGQIKYVEVFKMFLFIMFVFALYSTKIQRIQGFDLAFAVTSYLVMLLILAGMVVNSAKKVSALYQLVIQTFQSWLQTLYVSWKNIRLVWVLFKNRIQDFYIAIQRQSVFCVYRCWSYFHHNKQSKKN